jgi:type II secretory pathway component PulC
MDSPSIAQGKKLAARFKQRQWNVLLARQVPESIPALKLNGITIGGKVPLAMINGKSLTVGDTATIALGPARVQVKLLKIEKDSVVVSVGGEEEPRNLRLR